MHGIRGKEGISPNEQPGIVIHSWVDQRAFSDVGKYRDIYFGDLSKRLGQHHLCVTRLIDILPTIWYPVAVKMMQSSDVRWHLLEEFLNFSDIFSALCRVYQQRKWISRNFILSNLDVSDLVHEEKTQDYVHSRAEQSYLLYCAGKKMSRSFAANSIIYTFENHLWEKMFITGIRHGCPATIITGYAHSTVNRMDLSYSLSPIEKDFAPLPDKILVNGIRAKKNLAEFGFESIPTEIIGAIRYESLTTMHVWTRNTDNKNRILVVLSVNFNGSVEMILKCTEAFRNLENIRVILKPHPAHSISDFSHYITHVPVSFSWSSDPIYELFEKSDLVLFTDSTASVEAANRGIPVLHIKSNFTIDINIFEDTITVPSANSPEQIRSIAMKILNSNEFTSDSTQKVIGELFAPVDEQKILLIISAERVS